MPSGFNGMRGSTSWSKISWRSEVPQWLAMAAMFAAAAWTWRGAPERVPVHWNLAGQVDRYGGKVEGLLFVPLLTIAIYALLIVLPRFDPGRANYARFAGAYTVIRIAVVTVMALIYGVTILSILGRPVDVATWVPLLVGAMFVLLGSGVFPVGTYSQSTGKAASDLSWIMRRLPSGRRRGAPRGS